MGLGRFAFTYAQRRRPAQKTVATAPPVVPSPSHLPQAATGASFGGAGASGPQPTKPGDDSASQPTEPLGRALAAALLLPIGAVVLAVLLFIGIGVNEPHATGLAAATPSALRQIVEQSIKSDLTADRLKDAFGTTQSSSTAACTVDPLPALPPDPPPIKPPANTTQDQAAIKQQEEAEAKRNRQLAAIAHNKELRARRDACRALLAARLASDPASQLLVQMIVATIVERTLSSAATVNAVSITSKSGAVSLALALPDDLERELQASIAAWLRELRQDQLTSTIVAGANARFEEQTASGSSTHAAGAGAGPRTERPASAADPIERGVARVLSAKRIAAALQRGFATDFQPGIMGNGVPGWSKDITGRIMWATMAFVFCAAFVFVLAAAFGQLRHVEETAARRWKQNGLVAIAILGGLVVAAPLALDGATIGPLQKALMFFASRYGLYGRMVAAVTVLDLVAVVGAVSLIVGSVATFLVEVHTSDDVKMQLAGLRVLFNSGVIFLLAGTLQVAALLRWPAAFYQDPTAQAMVTTANWVATSIGAVFTVVLLAVYLPSVSILHEQVRLLPPNQQATAENFFDKAGFGDTGIQQISRLLMAFAPLLTGLTLTIGQTL